MAKVYLALTRKVEAEEPTGPYGHILGVYSNHNKAEDAIREFYKKIASDSIGGRIDWLDDLTARILSVDQEVTYVGSVLKKYVQ